MERNIPPVLAAQSAFYPGPLMGFHKTVKSTREYIFDQRDKISPGLPFVRGGKGGI